ncbi:MAG: hypothetical protein J6Z35_11515 [Lachnospiraceae bacterium]|nr:hypothetical protein [Lachnospiraceae bacterium]
MLAEEIIEKNRNYWNDHADLWYGTTALPEYGVRFPTEEELHLFGDVSGKGMLEICCGSWHHTLNYCIAWSGDERREVFDNGKLVMSKSYFDESYFKMPVHDSEIILCNRKISTYVNALAKAGFVIEQLVEESDQASLEAENDPDPKTRKAGMLPLSFCIKARKL